MTGKNVDSSGVTAARSPDGAVYVIAGWRFDPSEPLLRGEGEARPLEDRAARALALLCRRRGDVVSKEDLLAEVWGGRTVSGNSVSIVMGSLRRALGDDMAAPSVIVTVARRGYRLLPEERTKSFPPGVLVTKPSKATTGWIAAGAVSIAVAIAGWALLRPVNDVTLAVPAPENASGDARYDRLAASLAPVVMHGANRLRGVLLLDGTPGQRPRIALRSKIVLWNGAPELALSATDTETHAVIWSGFAAGPPARLARHVEDRIVSLEPHLPR